MDADIHFGDLEETRPDVSLRPDRNRHFAVAEVGAVREGELPIFVDLDAMLDMEEHALSDTSVELGGVMLGGHYEDHDGRPFVLVSDSLRAQHYESTKGSFKFTHETWEEITRQRDEFPEDLQMVGWYHTHPGWGVFLSGMDMFICDHFFNKPLDVALVIDPCRDDRGMFQWTDDPRERVRRTGGFYLIASRFREAELHYYAALLEGDMGADLRSSRFAKPGAMGAPVVNITQPRDRWQAPAVLAVLAMQLLLIALIAWRVLAPMGGGEDSEMAERIDKVVAHAEQSEALRRLESEKAAQAAVIDAFAESYAEEGSLVGVPERLAQREQEVRRLMATVDSHQLRLEALERQLGAVERERDALAAVKETQDKKLDKLAEERDSIEEEFLALKKRTAAQDESGDGELQEGEAAEGPPWWWISMAALLVAGIVGLGIAAAFFARRPEEDAPPSDELSSEEFEEQPPREDDR